MSAVSIIPIPVDHSGARLSVVPKFKFIKAKDARGRDIDGLWIRNGRFYYQQSVPGKGCSKRPLKDTQNQPVRTIQQAKDAIEALRLKRREGEVPCSGRAPRFDEYVEYYLTWMNQTQAKKPKTLVGEQSILRRWAKFFRGVRLNQITLRDVNGYVLKRKSSTVSNRTVNMDVLVLGNLFRFARKDGVCSGKPPTDGWEKLEYHAEKQKLFTKEEIDHFCAVAISQNADGTPRFKNGEMLRDAVRLMSLSGARLASALALCWSDMNWEKRQVTFWRDTKYSKTIIVDFNPELEAMLKDLHSRRPPDTDALFPSNRKEGSKSIASLRKSFELVREAANLPDFKFHSLRHYFVSRCVMAGIDLLTIAAWAGHADTVLHLNQDTTNTELHSPETRNANLKRCRPTPT